MSTITLTNVTKQFSKNSIAIDNLSLRITQGEFLTIMGPSGCGKTTLLRLITGFEKPTSGDVLFDTTPVSKIAPGKRGISMVFQDYALYNHMTVRNNMAFGLKERGLNKQEIEQRIQEVSELLDIVPLLDRKPRALSGGQKQRVAIGRAIVRKPNIIIFDEPFSNLDSVLCRMLQKELIRLHKALNSTFIYVTHSKSDAFAMGTKIAIMKDGKIMQIGTPSEFYEHPVNTFIANLICDNKLNFIDMKLKYEDNRVLLVSPDNLYAFSLDSSRFPTQNIAADTCVTVSISPTNFQLNSTDDSLDCHLSATVIRTDRLGKTTELLCVLPDGHEIKCILSGDYDVPQNQIRELYFSSNGIHIFDSETNVCII